ncbi:MAG TPA: tetratricopeptide repeat protein [Myxococcales bacterium]|nr:tetratricopeptide repeat protein [Myxococcales bacterium]
MLPLLLVLSLAASPGQHQVAQRLYDKASASYAAGHYERALRDFAAAYQLDPATSLLFNIAQCHRKLGHWKDALSYYRSYLSERPDSVNRAAVEALIEEAQAHVPAEPSRVAAAPATAAPAAKPTPGPAASDVPAAPASPRSLEAAAPAPVATEAVQPEPVRPPRSHWLGVSLLAATVVCAGFAVFGTVRAAQYLGMTNAQRLAANEPNDNNWANAAVVLGVATVGGAVGTGFAW